MTLEFSKRHSASGETLRSAAHKQRIQETDRICHAVPLRLREIIKNNRLIWQLPPETLESALREKTARISQGIIKLTRTLQDIDGPAKFDISVIVPARNEEKNILAVLESLSFQITDKRIEVIVVVNNSRDRTAELGRRCGARVIEYAFESDDPDVGYFGTGAIGYARQRGLEAAGGNIILTTDADTVMGEKWLESMTTALNHPGVACVTSLGRFYDKTDLKSMAYDLARSIARRRQYAKNRTYIARSISMAFRREEGLASRGYLPSILAGEDVLLGKRLAKTGKIVCLFDSESIVWTSARQVAGNFVLKALSLILFSTKHSHPGE